MAGWLHHVHRNSSLSTQFVPVSDPCPVVTLGALLSEDVAIAGDTATFKVSGTVADALADIMPNNLADIVSVRLLINDEEHIAPTALAAGDGGAPTFWRRHPFRGVFNELQVSLPSRGSHIVTVETAENAAGRKGWQSLALNFHSAAEEFFGGTNFMANIHIATNLTDTVADIIQFFHGDGGPYEDDPRLAETGAATLVFTGRLDKAGIEVSIGAFSGLSTNVDSFVAELRYNISTNYQPVYSNLFVETSATSGLFRCASAFTVGRDDLTVEVMALGGTLPGTCVPTVERVKGPAGLLGNGDCTLGFMGETFELDEEGDWFYPQGGSPRFSIPVPDPDDPSTGKIIIFEKKNGVLNKYGVQNWALSSTLFWCNLEIYDIKVQVVMIQSVRLPEAPSDGLVVQQGSNVVMQATILPISFSPPENEPKWYYQRLKSGGTWEEWTSFGEKASGAAYTNKTELSGVFRVKTVLSINGAFLCEKIYARTADEPWGYEKAGEPDAFGVVDTKIQITLRNSAKSWLGNTKYAVDEKLDAEMGFPARNKGANKCNLFVAHRAHESGAVVPLIGGRRRKDPPSANQWAGQDNTRPWIPCGHSTYIKNWTLLLHPTYPQPGFIVAHPNNSGPGHVGIVDYNGNGIAAGKNEVNKLSKAFGLPQSGFRKYDEP